MSTIHLPEGTLPLHWRQDQWSRLREVSFFSVMVDLALEVYRSVDGPVVGLSGPLTTGGLGNEKANMLRYSQAVMVMRANGLNVFNPIPFQNAIWQCMPNTKWNGVGYAMPILEEFYGPIFESGIITEQHFLPDWESSTGCKYERRKTLECGILHKDFSPEWLFECGKITQIVH